MEQFVKIIKALGDRNRIRILKMLEERPLCVCEITAVLGLAFSTTSKHLSILRGAQLIFEQKEGKWVNYHLNDAGQNKYVRELLPFIRQSMKDDERIKKDIAKTSMIDRNEICKG